MQSLDKLRHAIVYQSASLKLCAEMLGKVSEDQEQRVLEMLVDGTRQLTKNIADYKQGWCQTNPRSKNNAD